MSTEISLAISNDALTASLKQDADKINTLHRGIAGTVLTAITIGQILTEIKNEVLQHGQWLPWVEANLEFTPQTANNYMRMFEHREKLEDRLKKNFNLGLSEAYKLIAGMGKRAVKPTQLPSATTASLAEAKTAMPETGNIFTEATAGYVTPTVETHVLHVDELPSQNHGPIAEQVKEYFINFLKAFPASELPSAVKFLKSLAEQFQSARNEI